MKECLKYYFTVEGETEDIYFSWLQDIINKQPNSKYNVKIVHKVCKDPLKYAKGLTNISKINITHAFDIESQDECHVQQVKTTIDRMKEAEKTGKELKFRLGYSNFTFELWIILHKSECNSSLIHRDKYLEQLNKAYDEHFEDLAHFKCEKELQRIFNKLDISNVREAIKRAKNIMSNNEKNNLPSERYKGFCYCKDNPSLSIWESVEKILKDCELL